MTEDLEQKLFETFPDLFPENERFGPRNGITCCDGWYWIILRLCSAIQAVSDKIPEKNRVKISYIKEDLGNMQIDFHGGDDTTLGMILFAIHLSGHTCELCGSMENVELSSKKSWMKTLCQACRERQNYRIVER